MYNTIAKPDPIIERLEIVPIVVYGSIWDKYVHIYLLTYNLDDDYKQT